MYIEIIPINTPLKRTVYNFYVGVSVGAAEVSIILDRYSEEERKSLRHKWQSIVFYNRILNPKASTIARFEIQLSEEVMQLCKERILSAIVFK